MTDQACSVPSSVLTAAGLVIAALSLVRVNLTAAVASLDAARDLVRSHEQAAQPRGAAPLG